MALRKPSEYFKKKEEVVSVEKSIGNIHQDIDPNTFSDAFESFKSNLNKIEVLSEFSNTLSDYRVSVEKVNILSETIKDIESEIQNLLTKEDLDRALVSQLLLVEQSVRDVQSKVKSINENNLKEIRSDVSELTKSVNEFFQVDVPKYKKLIVDSEVRISNRYEELKENVNETLSGIEEFVDNKYQHLTENLQAINKENLSGILSDFEILKEEISKFKETDIPKYKNFIVETEIKTETKLNEFQEKLDDTVSDILEKINLVEGDKIDLVNAVNQKIKDVKTLNEKVTEHIKSNQIINEEHKQELNKKITDLEIQVVRNESHIKVQNKNLEQIQEDVVSTIKKLKVEELEEKNYEISKKIKYLEEIFEKFSEKEILSENLLAEPPSTKNKDSLTPLDQNFVTLDQLQQHYRLFINRIQQQLATFGGGGETRLKYLDDIVGIATNPSAYDGKYLRYNHSSGNFQFSDISSDDDSWVDNSYGTYTNANVGIGTSVPQYDLDVNGDINFNGSFYQNGSPFVASRWTAGNGDDIYRLNGSVGIGTTNPTSKLYVDGDSTITGVLTASSFYGSAIGLTGIGLGNIYYVGTNGSDTNSGDGVNNAFATIEKAFTVATSGDQVFVGGGTFTENFPLTIPQGVSLKGSGLRSTLIQPTNGTKTNDALLINGDTTVEDLTIANFYRPGYAFRFANGAKTLLRSPYIQRVTVLTRGTQITTDDPYGFDTPHNPPTSYAAGNGILIDGSVVDPTTLEPAILFNECTFITPNSTALEMTNGARAEWVNCWSYFADKSIYAYVGNVGLASTGRTRIKVASITGDNPTTNDLVYYLNENSVSGTYERVGTAVTVTSTSHGLTTSTQIYADFTSGSATDGFFTISGITTDTFTFAHTGSGTTSGNVSYKKVLGFGTVTTFNPSTEEIALQGRGEGRFQTAQERTGRVVTAYGDAKVSDVAFKFGTGSALFDGTGDYLQLASTTDFGFGTGDFTIEAFIRITSLGTTKVIYDFRDSALTDTAPVLYVNGSDILSYNINSTTNPITGTTVLSTNTWYHVAVSRSGGSTKLFLDGSQEGSTYSDTNDYGTSKPIRIGLNVGNANGFVGYIDELRVSNSGRYNGIFIPTTSEFNSDANTKLLLHCDGSNNSDIFIDATLVTQDVRFVRSGITTATSTRITLADYQQFGGDMRSIGCASVFGNTGITANGVGVRLRLFAYNFGFIGSGKDFSQDLSLVNQEAEVIELNGGRVQSVSIDQNGDFRVGNAFYVNEEEGLVTFGGQEFNISSLSNLDITDGTNVTTITPTNVTVGNLQLSGNTVTTTAGDLTLDPSGTNKTRIVGDLEVAGIITASSFNGNASSATYAHIAGIATYALTAGIATYSSRSGIATYSSTAGIATYAHIAGIATYALTAGIATYSSTAGIATYASTAGVSTSVIGGIGSITSLSVSGITTTGLLNVGVGGTIITTTGIGSVGIGSTQPTAKLDVVGDVKATRYYGEPEISPVMMSMIF